MQIASDVLKTMSEESQAYEIDDIGSSLPKIPNYEELSRSVEQLGSNRYSLPVINKPNKHNNPSPQWNNLSYSKLNLDPKPQVDFLLRNRNSHVVLSKHRNAATLQPTTSEMSVGHDQVAPPGLAA